MRFVAYLSNSTLNCLKHIVFMCVRERICLSLAVQQKMKLHLLCLSCHKLKYLHHIYANYIRIENTYRANGHCRKATENFLLLCNFFIAKMNELYSDIRVLPVIFHISLFMSMERKVFLFT